MNTHTEYAKQLNSFTYKFNTIQAIDFSISEETNKRITISKLYYALYHRILEELPNLQTSKGSNKHESIEKILDKQCCNGNFYVTLAELFKDLKELRVWADYQALSSMPKEVNLSLLQRKTFDKIKSSKLIY